MTKLTDAAADVLALLSTEDWEIISKNDTNIIKLKVADVTDTVDPLVMAELVMLGYLVRQDTVGYAQYQLTETGMEKAKCHNQDQ